MKPDLLADLRGIAEGDCKEEGGDGQSQDQDEAKLSIDSLLGFDQLRVEPAGGT